MAENYPEVFAGANLPLFLLFQCGLEFLVKKLCTEIDDPHLFLEKSLTIKMRCATSVALETSLNLLQFSSRLGVLVARFKLLLHMIICIIAVVSCLCDLRI